eukprot:scaffold361649_cov16-Prasinocladus_malaysianus.AAC.1
MVGYNAETAILRPKINVASSQIQMQANWVHQVFLVAQTHGFISKVIALCSIQLSAQPHFCVDSFQCKLSGGGSTHLSSAASAPSSFSLVALSSAAAASPSVSGRTLASAAGVSASVFSAFASLFCGHKRHTRSVHA